MANKDYNGNGFLVSNASATQGPFALLGGKYGFTWIATLGGGHIDLQVLGPDGSTYVNVVASVTSGTSGYSVIDLPPGIYQLGVTTATAVYASVIPVSNRR